MPLPSGHSLLCECCFQSLLTVCHPSSAPLWALPTPPGLWTWVPLSLQEGVLLTRVSLDAQVAVGPGFRLDRVLVAQALLFQASSSLTAPLQVAVPEATSTGHDHPAQLCLLSSL